MVKIDSFVKEVSPFKLNMLKCSYEFYKNDLLTID